MAMPNVTLPQGISSGGRPRRQETMGDRPAQTRFESLSKQSYDSPLRGVNTPRSDKDRIELKELMEICTKFLERVLDLETTKTVQAKEIANLKKRVKKLERKRKSRTLGMNLFKIDSDFDEEFDANIDEVIEQVYDDNKDTVEEGEVQVPTADMEVNTASAPITTVSVSVSTAESITTAEPSTPPPTTTTTTTVIEDEDLIILAARLQEQEQGKLTIEERSKMFVDLMDKRKKHFDKLRVEGSKKRTREEPDEESVKRQKLEDDAKKAELKLCLEIVPYD
ncbi:hypothetical protein Tco_1425086, partial [Tanacetum coccineum]